MKKYEYKVVNFVKDFDIESELVEMGSQGWKFINYIKNDGMFSLIFEREL